jgi:hypothetical protein
MVATWWKEVYRDVIYAGEHPAIIEPALWEKVNDEFRARQRKRSDAARTKQHALLAGCCSAMAAIGR